MLIISGRDSRLLVKLQSEEIQVHAQELSKVWHQLDEEKDARLALEKHVLTLADENKKVRDSLYPMQVY